MAMRELLRSYIQNDPSLLALAENSNWEVVYTLLSAPTEIANPDPQFELDLPNFEEFVSLATEDEFFKVVAIDNYGAWVNKARNRELLDSLLQPITLSAEQKEDLITVGQTIPDLWTSSAMQLIDFTLENLLTILPTRDGDPILDENGQVRTLLNLIGRGFVWTEVISVETFARMGTRLQEVRAVEGWTPTVLEGPSWIQSNGLTGIDSNYIMETWLDA